MKLLWLSHLLPYPPKAGVLQRAHYLLRETARHHEVHLLAFHQPELLRPFYADDAEAVSDARRALEAICREVQVFRIRSEEKPLGRLRLALRSLVGPPYNIGWLASAEYRRALRECVQRVRPDLVHFDTISLVPCLDELRGAPAVLDHHNVESHLLLRRAENERNPLRRLYYWQEGRRLEAWERRYCPRFALNLTCSELDSERLRRIVPAARVESVPNPVDLDYFRPNPQRREDAARLVFVGTLSWYPNRAAALFIGRELWPRLRAALPDLSVDLVGAGPPPELLELSCREPDFRVHGAVPDIRPFLDAAAVYVCPIRDGGGTKLKLLDAFAMEKAVVAHPVACEGIAARDGKEICFAEEPEDFAEKILSLLRDPDRRLALGRAARGLAEREYSTAAVGARLSELYERCAKGKSEAA